MIHQDSLIVNLKEVVLELQNKQYMNELMGIKDYQLDNIVKILELCQDTIKDGTYDEGYDCGYEQAKDEYEVHGENSFKEGWDEAIETVQSILEVKGIVISEIEDL